MLEKIKELRARTFLSMNDCKIALEKSDYDVEKAIEYLQKNVGLKKADSLSLALEGRVLAKSSGSLGAIVEVNCQTDFAAKSDLFIEFVDKAAQSLMSVKNVDVLSSKDYEFIAAQLGEKVVFRRSNVIYNQNQNARLTAYNHLGGKIAVLLESLVSLDYNHLALENVAMQIAATKPLALDKKSLPKELVEKQKEKFLLEVENKPESVKDKIVTGKMEKWYSEVCLLNQDCIFIEGNKKMTVENYLKQNKIEKIQSFSRYEKGEL